MQALASCDNAAVAAGKSTIPFPYDPYPQQHDLMQSIYDTICQGRSGCFESPTGTGKSLSILCAALHWQRLQENAVLYACEKACDEAHRAAAGSGGTGSGSKAQGPAAPAGGDWLADILSSTGSTDDTAAAKKESKSKRKALTRLSKLKNRLGKAAAVDPSNTPSVEALFGSNSSSRAGGFRFGGTGISAATSKAAPADVAVAPGGEEEEFVLDAYESDDGGGFARGAGVGDGSGGRSGSKGGGRQGKQRGPGSTDVDALLNDPFGLDGGSDSDSDSETEEGNASGESTTAQDDKKYAFREKLQLPQIFYCSRTHSQIAQFVSEMQKTAYGHDLRCVTLGSRKNMCINPDVARLSSDSRISDKCLDMQKNGSSSVSSVTKAAGRAADGAGTKKQRIARLATCKFKSKRLEQVFAEFSASKVRDIEELVSLGRQLEVCPYYSTRRAVQFAQVVCAPYSVLLHEDTRASMGIDLRNAVVIFDEAHNVVEAVNAIHSADVSSSNLEAAHKAVSIYLTRFQLALSGKNLFYVTLLGTVLKKLMTAVKMYEKRTAAAAAVATGAGGAAAGVTDATDVPGAGMELHSCNDFLFAAKLDNVNMFKLKRHVTSTNLIGKIGGFSESQARKAAALAAATAFVPGPRPISATAPAPAGCATCAPAVGEDGEAINDFNAHTHALRAAIGLLSCLTNSDADGRVVLIKVPVTEIPASPPDAAAAMMTRIKFILLNPAVHFKKIADEARSVLLLGGTLQPFNYVTASLFEGCAQPIRGLQLFACGHVVDKSNVLALAMGRGPNGVKLEFTHKTRSTNTITDELFYTLLQAARTCPFGMVVFFTSYAYMAQLLAKWSTQGFLNKLAAYKRSYTEPRTVAESEKVWEQYSATVTAAVTAAAIAKNSGKTHNRASGNGAILFCVMGGKLSEGINFSDALARCVVVVGMPFPDGRDPVLQEKMKRADLQEKQSGGGNGSSNNAGKRLYEAMCMKSVNQSIGRSIRHANDYAAILLLDARYEQESVIRQLPGWIARSIERPPVFAEALVSLNTFFSSKG